MTSHSAHTEELLGPMSPVAQKAAPERLHYRGRRELLETGTRIAVVGSRRASVDGLSQARKLVQQLADNDVTVVSGLALGIDTVAHQTAIACGAGTIAVLGTSLDRYATHQNQELQDQIGRDHLLLSQFPDGTPPQRHHFPQHNKNHGGCRRRYDHRRGHRGQWNPAPRLAGCSTGASRAVPAVADGQGTAVAELKWM